MEKLKLNKLVISDGEMLSRDQLKKVFGGMGSDDGCNTLPMGCGEYWHAEICLIEPSYCPFGTLVCVPDDQGCKYYM